jgi:hypothetical protein
VLRRLCTEPLPYVLSPYVMNRSCVEPAYVLGRLCNEPLCTAADTLRRLCAEPLMAERLMCSAAYAAYVLNRLCDLCRLCAGR